MYLLPPAKKRMRDHRSKCFIPVGMPFGLKLKGRPVIHSISGKDVKTLPITYRPFVWSISPGSSQPRISPDDFSKAMLSAAHSSLPGGHVCHKKCDRYLC